jgi:hypothetical protein
MMVHDRSQLGWLLAAGCLAFVLAFPAGRFSAWADEAKEPPAKSSKKLPGARNAAKRAGEPKSLDEQLLQDLDNELLPAGDQPAPKRGGKDSARDDDAAEDPDAATGEDLGEHGDEDILSRIGDKMRKAEGLIERQKSPEKAQQLQDEVVSDLAKLIDQLRERAQQQSSSSKSQQKTAQRQQVNQPKSSSRDPKGGSPNPAKDSTERLGKNDVRRPDMGEMHDLMKDVWGQLPVHDREQMLQYAPEQFLPKYELLIEKYYKRLAEPRKDRP